MLASSISTHCPLAWHLYQHLSGIPKYTPALHSLHLREWEGWGFPNFPRASPPSMYRKPQVLVVTPGISFSVYRRNPRSWYLWLLLSKSKEEIEEFRWVSKKNVLARLFSCIESDLEYQKLNINYFFLFAYHMWYIHRPLGSWPWNQLGPIPATQKGNITLIFCQNLSHIW